MASTRIGILVVAYNAASTLERVLDRIPMDFRPRITKILVGDDASQDSTHLVALGYQQINGDYPIEVVRHPENLGYGGNQKAGYQWAIDNDLDIVVLLHGDGQYAPEILADMVAPLERGEADAVFGSRMLDRGAARRGGMPRYKYVGNKVLSRFENAVAGAQLSEWHSGYRAYSVAALREIPFHVNDDGFNFDTQVIVQLIEADKRIAEIPIPTYYGDEICHVNGMAYARDIARDVVRYRAHKMGFGTGELAFASDAYEEKHGEDSSHQTLLRWLSDAPPGRVLDVGCSDGYLSGQLRDRGHEVTGIDVQAHDGVKARVDRFLTADLDRGLPDALDGPYDIVVLADVLEHTRNPGAVLEELRAHIGPSARVLISVPNFGHWYPRVRVAAGRFDYDRRGILDRDHVRFFTKRSFERLIADTGYRVVKQRGTGLPLEVADRGAAAGAEDRAEGGGLAGVVGRVDRAAVAVRPQLFAYQLLYEVSPRV